MIKLFRFLKPYRVTVVVIVLLTFLRAFSDVYLPALMANIVDVGIVKGDIPYILRVGVFMSLVAIGGTICAVIASLLSARVAVGFGRIIRAKLFTHVQEFSLHEFDKLGASSLITRTTNDTNQVQLVLVMMLRMMLGAPLMFVGSIIMAVITDVKLSLVLVASVPVLAISIWLITSKSIPLFTIIQTKLDKLNIVLDENLTGIRVIRSLNRMDHERRRFTRANQDLTDTSIKANQIVAALFPVMMLVMNFSIIAIFWFGSIRIASGDLQVGSLIAFIQYATQILFSLLMVSFLFIMIPRASASAVRINEILDITPGI